MWKVALTLVVLVIIGGGAVGQAVNEVVLKPFVNAYQVQK